MGVVTPLHALPIADRPKKTWSQTLNAVLYIVMFNLGCLMIFGFQCAVLIPLRLVPVAPARHLYYEGVRYSKGAFGTLVGTFPFFSRVHLYRLKQYACPMISQF